MTEKQGPIGITSSRKRQKNRSRPRPLMDGGSANKEYGPNTPVAIYTRVSTDEQAEKGLSLSAQQNACRKFADHREWTVVEVYEDPGYSGKNDKRPDFQNMLEGARQGTFKVVLIHKLDRFSRNIDSTLKNFRFLNDHDVTLASVTEEFDYSTPMGRMFFHMMAVFAQWYLENLSAETAKGKKERVRKGLHNGSLSFGYKSAGSREPAELVPDEAEATHGAFELYSTGEYSNRQIADYLNQKGFKTRRGRRWSKDAVREFLQNDFYCGVVSYKDEKWPGKHEPIIDKDLFNKCLSVRNKRSRRSKSYSSKPKRHYLLQRIIRCDRCGRHLRMQSTRMHFYYREASRDRGLICEHAGTSIRMDHADPQVLDILTKLRLPQNWQKEIEEMAADFDETNHIEKERQHTQEQLRRLVRTYQDGLVDDKEYERKRDSLQAKLEGLIIPDSATLLEQGLQLENLEPYLQEATEAERSEIAHLILETVHVDLETQKITRFKPTTDFLHIFRMTAQESGWEEGAKGQFTGAH